MDKPLIYVGVNNTTKMSIYSKWSKVLYNCNKNFNSIFHRNKNTVLKFVLNHREWEQSWKRTNLKALHGV